MPRISEEKAAALIVESLSDASEEAWPKIYHELTAFPAYQGKFLIDDEEAAVYDLFLAIFAMEFRCLDNLVASDQASRLLRHGIESIRLHFHASFLDYAKAEISLYRAAEDSALKAGDVPMYAIPARLVVKLLGDRVKTLEIDVAGDRFIDPILIMAMTDLVFRHIGLGRWKNLLTHESVVNGT